MFFADSDHRAYFDILRELYGVTAAGYCLMTNHIHLGATPGLEDSLSLASTARSNQTAPRGAIIAAILDQVKSATERSDRLETDPTPGCRSGEQSQDRLGDLVGD